MKNHQSKSLQFKNIKLIIFISFIIIVSGYFIFIFFNSIKSGSNDVNMSGLEVSTNSDADIYVDGSKIGSSSKDKSLFYTKIDPGKRRIKIIKINDDSVKYENDIIFEKGTKTTVQWDFGPTSETSSGIVRYFIKKIGDKNKIRVISLTQKSEIFVDGTLNNDGIIEADGIDHNIEVSKEGYLSKNITLSLANKTSGSSQISSQDKEKYDDYDLVVEFTLFQIPFI
ncbi:MAG: hypothetical protein WCJ19_05370 [bacterium]